MTTTAYPGAYNTFVPLVSGKLVVDYSRNVDDFPVNKYAQMVPVEKNNGFYTQMTRAQAGRVQSAIGADVAWPDGSKRPIHNDELESFAFQPYRTVRYDWGFNLGNLAADQASFDVIAHNAGIVAERAMRFRALQVCNVATTTSNYPSSSNYSAVSSIPGVTGYWDQSTTARKAIETSFHYAAFQIIKDTLNGVSPKDLIVVLPLEGALAIKLSQEIIDYIKGSVDALAEVVGNLRGQNPYSYWGLPSKLFGYTLVIEDTQYVTSAKGASTLSTSPILAYNNAFMCSRVGGLVSERASESSTFSTLTMFMKEEMTVEQFNEAKHRRVEHHVTDDFQAVMTAGLAGFLFTNTVTTAYNY